MSLLGETGLRRLAELNHARARELKQALAAVPGVEVLTPRFFNELAVRVPADAAALVEACLADGVVAGVPFSRLAPEAGLDDVLLLAATETTTSEDVAALVRTLERNLGR
jgi:glycine dehydrogenase subunit 1